MSVFDPSVMLRLVDDPSSPCFVREFVGRYSALLALRVERVVEAVSDTDLEDALDAVLSLKSSSAMTGLLDLSGVAAQVEACLRRGDRLGARRLATTLPTAAVRAHAALTRYLATSSRGSDSMR